MSDSQFIDDLSAIDPTTLGDIEMPNPDQPTEAVRGPVGMTPKAGRYTLQFPEVVKVGAWPASDRGPGSIELKMDTVQVIDPGGEGDGLEMRYIAVSTRRIGGANASSATDLLLRTGYNPLPRNAEEWQYAAQSLSNARVEGVYCDWECRAPKATDEQRIREFLKAKGVSVTDARAKKVLIRGMSRFPKNEDGTFQSRLHYEDGPDGAPLTLYANLKPSLRGFGLTKEELAARG